MTRRRFLGLGAGTAVGAAGLTGCSGAGGSLAGPDELSMWTWVGSVNDALIAQAERAIPGASTKRLVMTRIGGDYNAKVLTSLAGKSLVPDILALNDDVATYFPNADQFVDLFELGAAEQASAFLDWKWKLGITPQNKMLAYPMDTGPTGLFYRRDLFQRAGLPAEPGEVAAAAPDWDGYIRLGRRLQRTIPGAAFTDNIVSVYYYALAQLPRRYLTPAGEYIGAGDHIRSAWDTAVRVGQEGLSANAQSDTTDANAVITNGRLAAYVGAVWWAQLGPKNAAPDTAGRWRVTDTPGGPGNRGGSFLAITKYCRDPQAAFAFFRWLQSARNQAEAFLDPVLFPSTPASYDDPRMNRPDPFFGGQRIVDVFGRAAERYPGAYFSPYDSIVSNIYRDELTTVEIGQKTSDRAWRDAQERIERELTRAGAI